MDVKKNGDILEDNGAEGQPNSDDAIDGGVCRVRVALKLPPFWNAQPELWFDQVEAHFHINNIKSDVTKYYTVIASIESSILSQVSDIIRKPPTENKYKALKDRIMEQFADSETKKTKILLSEIELGDRKPSQLLLEMRELAGNRIGDEFLKSLWMQRMPSHVRTILSVSSEELNVIAKLADKMLEVGGYQQISVTSSKNVTDFSILQQKIDQLSSEIATLKINRHKQSFQQNGRGRNRSRSKSTSNLRSRSSSKKPTCWYHYKFGSDAKKCNAPCAYKHPEN